MCDKPESAEKSTGVLQIEVTPEMSEAGFGALLDGDPDDRLSRTKVVEVFCAMLLAAPKGWLEAAERG